MKLTKCGTSEQLSISKCHRGFILLMNIFIYIYLLYFESYAKMPDIFFFYNNAIDDKL